METTPNDLRQQQFEIKFRGYNPDDVEVFRDLAANALEEARAQVLQLTEENRHLRQRLEHLLAMEETLKAAVLETQKNSDIIIANARKEADVTVSAAKKEGELIIREAKQRGDEMMNETHRQLSKLVTDINKLRFIRTNYLSKLRSLLRAQLDMVEQASGDDAQEQRAATRPPEPASGEARQQSFADNADMFRDATPPERPIDDHGLDEHLAGEGPSPRKRYDTYGAVSTDRPTGSSGDEWEKLKEQLGEE
jgi:cell division initiation protein